MRKLEFKEHITRLRRIQFVDSLIGALLCAVTALGVSVLAAGHSWMVSVPLAFSAVVLLISSIFGTRAGVLGTLLAAAVFAVFLFNPTGSLEIKNQAARTNLGWMLLIGVSFSFLFAPPTGGFRRH